MKSYCDSDLDEICSHSSLFMSTFKNRTILVAGGTGFVGSWLLATFEFMNSNYSSNIKVTSLSRNFSQEAKDNFPNTNFLALDLAKTELELKLRADLLINAATPSTSAHGGEDPSQILNASILGTKKLLELSRLGSKPTFINLSSGIVSKRILDSSLDLSTGRDSYLEGKRVSEDLVASYTTEGIVYGKNLRLFAFAGPGIPLLEHFAVGNFLNDAVHNRPIEIKGNPQTVRSYLYPTDLIINILECSSGTNSAVCEIGSFNTVTMQQLATIINNVTGNSEINQSSTFGPIDEYFPKVKNDNFYQNVELPEAISRWKNWLESPA